mgnify:CR=1 FL=1
MKKWIGDDNVIALFKLLDGKQKCLGKEVDKGKINVKYGATKNELKSKQANEILCSKFMN